MNPVVRSFTGCQYGPLQVRGALRRGRVRGERLVGWATATRRLKGPEQFMLVAMMFVPGVGQIISAAATARLVRLLVLTDRRLLLLPADKRALRTKHAPLVLESPIGEVEVLRERGGSVLRLSSQDGPRQYLIDGPGLPGPIGLTVGRQRSRAGRRLLEGLEMLSRSEAL
jgi:hypothetical protein